MALLTPARRAKRGVKLSMPADLAPMLAVSSDLPAEDGGWGYEIKWDGVRAICYWDGKSLRLRSRNNLDMTAQYPELQALGRALGDRPAVLDGEVVALDELDRPSFTHLQKRMKVTHAATALHLSQATPVWLMIFDLLYVDGKSVMDKPLLERRELLEELTVEGPSWQVSPLHRGNGAAHARSSAIDGAGRHRRQASRQPI